MQNHGKGKAAPRIEMHVRPFEADALEAGGVRARGGSGPRPRADFAALMGQELVGSRHGMDAADESLVIGRRGDGLRPGPVGDG